MTRSKASGCDSQLPLLRHMYGVWQRPEPNHGQELSRTAQGCGFGLWIYERGVL